MSSIEIVKKFIEPGSVALLGVTRQTGEAARNILENLLSYPYEGKIYPVNPNADEILGVKCFPKVGDIPDDNIDLAVINLPRPLVVPSFKECIAKGIKAVIIVTQGFMDSSDDEGKRLQKELDALVKESGTRVIGPNTYGTANGYTRFSSAFNRPHLLKVPVGIICQTGGFYNGLPGLECTGKGFDIGNGSDIDFADCMEYLEQDELVKAVVLHIEGIRDGKRFLAAAHRLAKKKPVVAIKTGRTPVSAGVIQSHTGSLAGKDEIWDAALAQVGVIRAHDVDELGDMVAAFSTYPLMKGNRIGIATNSGGMGIICVDACFEYGLVPAQLSQSTVDRIQPMYPEWLRVKNPIDTVAASLVQKKGMSHVFQETADAFFKDENVDAVLYLWVAPTKERAMGAVSEISEFIKTHMEKPLVCSFQGPHAQLVREELDRMGKVTEYHNPSRAIRALARLWQYSKWRAGIPKSILLAAYPLD